MLPRRPDETSDGVRTAPPRSTTQTASPIPSCPPSGLEVALDSGRRRTRLSPARTPGCDYAAGPSTSLSRAGSAARRRLSRALEDALRVRLIEQLAEVEAGKLPAAEVHNPVSLDPRPAPQAPPATRAPLVRGALRPRPRDVDDAAHPWPLIVVQSRRGTLTSSGGVLTSGVYRSEGDTPLPDYDSARPERWAQCALQSPDSIAGASLTSRLHM